MTVAILAMEDKTGDPQAAHWGYTLRGFLESQLTEVRSIRVLPPGAPDYGLRQLKLRSGEPINAKPARTIGEMIEARRVVWGYYGRNKEQWQVVLRVLNVASGRTSEELRAESEDWLEIRDRITAQVLDVLGVSPSCEEKSRMARRGTTSFLALEAFSEGYALYREQESLSETEAAARRALEADMNFAEAHGFLAVTLATQGRYADAEKAVRHALRIRPDYSTAHRALGLLLFLRKEYVQGEGQLREALRLDPDNPATLIRLGEIYLTQQKRDKASAAWKAARRLDPYSAAAWAHLGHLHALDSDRKKALSALKEAERLDSQDPNALQMICQAFDILSEPAAALASYERFLRVVRRLGVRPAVAAKFEKRVAELKQTLSLHFVRASLPKIYTEQSLRAALDERLGYLARLATDPLSSTPEMRRWAKQLTDGVEDEMEKARKLFEATARRIDPGVGGSRTACEVFAAWRDPSVSFWCQEYARLYVAMARAVGIQAFFVRVDEDFKGRAVLHACAGIFVDGNALLIDPTYRWFGVPHETVEFLDDLQAVGLHMSQLDGDILRCRAAVKLIPDFAPAQFNLAFLLFEAGQPNGANQVLQDALRLDPEGWLADYAQGAAAAYSGRWEQAVKHLQRSLEVNPDWDKSYFLLGKALQMQGNLNESREKYRSYLRNQLQSDFAESAHHAIAQINEKLGAE